MKTKADTHIGRGDSRDKKVLHGPSAKRHRRIFAEEGYTFSRDMKQQKHETLIQIAWDVL